MTIATIANAEAGSSVRAKLNLLIGLANADLINPIELGAGGDGVADDTAESNAAIADQNSTGRGIFLPPGKVFKVTSDLTVFTNGMTVVGGGALLAANGVALLRHFPTGWATGATERTATSLSLVAWQGLSGQNVTQIILSNTSGFSVGQWIKFGSSTILCPGPDQNFYFEWAQIRSIATNSSITLDRVLEGHARGILPNTHANYRLFGMPLTRGVLVDVAFVADETAASISATNLTNRQPFLTDRGSVAAVIRVRGRRWWTTLLRLSNVHAQVEAHWQELPDITDAAISTANHVFAYGVHAHGGCYGLTAKLNGGTCRNGFATAPPTLASYDAARPFDLGMTFYCGTTPDSRVSGASAAAYDTHVMSFGTHLRGEADAGVEQVDSDRNALGAQNRGFCSTLSVRVASASYVGYQLEEGNVNWGLLGTNVTVLDNIEVRDANGGSHVRIEGISTVSAITLVFRHPVFIGPLSGAVLNAVDIQSGFAGKIILESPLFRDFSGRCVMDQSGLGRVQIHGGHVEWRGGTTPTTPFRIASTAADRGDGTTATWIVDGFYVGQISAAAPSGLFAIDLALNANVSLGRVTFATAGMPMRSAASTGGQIVLTKLFDLGELNPFLNATGNMAAAPPNRKFKLTGNTTGWPIFDGFDAVLVNGSGANRTVSPASGTCIVAETGATSASVTIANNKGVSIAGDGTNLWIFGDTV